jgi:uncharacterized membrane protein YvbJ
MDSKEKWIQQVENSIEGIEQAAVNPYLYSKIMNRIQQKALVYVKPKLVWISLASFAILVVLNVLVFGVSRQAAKPETELKQLSNALNLLNENAINYN